MRGWWFIYLKSMKIFITILISNAAQMFTSSGKEWEYNVFHFNITELAEAGQSFRGKE